MAGRRKMGRQLRRILLVVLAGLLLLEGGLRLVLGNFAQSRLLQRSDLPGVCLENQPGVELTYTGWFLRQPPTTMRTNALGGRGPEVPPPGERPRVLLLGDSFTFGQGVEEDQTFGAALEKHLRALGTEVEVLNFGVPGHSQPQSVALLEQRLLPLRPDLVLLVVFANDLSPVDSYCARGKNEVPAERFLLQNVYVARAAMMLGWAPGSFGAQASGEDSPAERYEAALAQARDLGAEHGFGVGVVFLTDADAFEDTRFCDDCPPAHSLDQAGLRTVDLGPLWHEFHDDVDAWFLPGENHFTPAANQRVGEAIAAAIVGWPELHE